MKRNDEVSVCLGRRAFLNGGTLLLATAASSRPLSGEEQQANVLKVGLVTDLHYADKPSRGSRHYRETLGKLAEAGEHIRNQKPDFVVELGDIIDAADSVDAELGYLKRINREFSTLCDKRHYVLGNHCVHTLTKQEFLDGVEQESSYYSFDSGDYHFIVLDSCFRSDSQPYGRKNFVWTDPNVPAAELQWLRDDLKRTRKQTIVFAHQRLDVSDQHGVKNAAEVRAVLEESGEVLAVFQGHSHKNDHNDLNGLHSCTLVAMVEGSGINNNGCSILKIAGDGTIRVEGFRKQTHYHWTT